MRTENTEEDARYIRANQKAAAEKGGGMVWGARRAVHMLFAAQAEGKMGWHKAHNTSTHRGHAHVCPVKKATEET